jgi:hypothetical protein
MVSSACHIIGPVRIDPEELRRHYRMLPDKALAELKRDELTEVAQAIYDEEVQHRESLAVVSDVETVGQQAAASEEDEEELAAALEGESAPEPHWLEDSACACAFAVDSARGEVTIAARARGALRAAGIPCHIEMVSEIPARVEPRPQTSLRLLVPGALALHATSVLDASIFNPELEADWRANFEALSDEELGELDPEVFCAGLLDRVARLKRAYGEEIARRKLKVQW